MKTFITGATGFLGSALARELIDKGEQVVALARPTSDLSNLEGLDIEIVTGDLKDEASLKAAMAGCDRAYHAAAEYVLWSKNPHELYAINVDGTRNLIRAARAAGVERVVYTSTVGALGNAGDGRPGTEATPVRVSDMVGDYKISKFMAEEVALSYAKDGYPVIIVNPSTPVGPRDIKPTPTGKMILDFLNGKMAAYLDTGLNLIDVRDAAAGHILAMEKGLPGEKYILGCRNMTLKEIFDTLASITGIPAPKVRLPYGFVLPIALLSTAVSDYVTKKPPLAPVNAVRMAKKKMFFDSAKAVRELGLPQTPVEGALKEAVEWFRQAGYCK